LSSINEIVIPLKNSPYPTSLNAGFYCNIQIETAAFKLPYLSLWELRAEAETPIATVLSLNISHFKTIGLPLIYV